MKTFHLLTTRTTLNSQKAFLSQHSQVLLKQGGKLREDKRQGPRPPGWIPFRVSVGVGPGEWRHSMAEDDVGIVEHLLHLHGPVGAPAHIVT